MTDENQPLLKSKIDELQLQVIQLQKDKEMLTQENLNAKNIINVLKQDIAEIQQQHLNNRQDIEQTQDEQQQAKNLHMIFEFLLKQTKNTISKQYQSSPNRLFLYQLNEKLQNDNQNDLKIFISQIIYNCIQEITKPIFTIDSIEKLPQLLFKQKLSYHKKYNFDFNIFDLHGQALASLSQIFINDIGKSTQLITVPENGIVVNQTQKGLVQSFHTIDQMKTKFKENKDIYQQQIDLVMIQNFQIIDFSKLKEFKVRHLQIMNTLGSIINFDEQQHLGTLESLTIIGCNNIQLDKMQYLKVLCICSCNIKYNDIQQLVNLQHLYIQNQEETLEIEQYLYNLGNLVSLMVTDCHIKDLSLTFACQKLEQIQLIDCQDANFVTIQIEQFPCLKYIDIDQLSLQLQGEPNQQLLVKAQGKWITDDFEEKVEQQ